MGLDRTRDQLSIIHMLLFSSSLELQLFNALMQLYTLMPLLFLLAVFHTGKLSFSFVAFPSFFLSLLIREDMIIQINGVWKFHLGKYKRECFIPAKKKEKESHCYCTVSLGESCCESCFHENVLCAWRPWRLLCLQLVDEQKEMMSVTKDTNITS